MENRGSAWFVESPRIIEDLIMPHPIEQEKHYQIVKVIKLMFGSGITSHRVSGANDQR